MHHVASIANFTLCPHSTAVYTRKMMYVAQCLVYLYVLDFYVACAVCATAVVYVHYFIV